MMRAVAGSQLRTADTGHEEFYCFLGTEQDSVVRVERGYKPPQETYLESGFGGFRGSYLTHELCPKSTVLSLHTHPWGGTTPSAVDSASFRRDAKRTHRFHAISTKHWDGVIGIMIYEVKDNGDIVPFDKDLIRFYRDTPVRGDSDARNESASGPETETIGRNSHGRD